MGRTGTLHACEQEGVAPDLHGDRQGPRRRLPADRRGARSSADRRCDRAAAAASSSTATPTSATRSPAPRRSRCSSDRARRPARHACARQGAYFDAAGCATRFGDHPHVGDIRGRGLFRAIELVEDRATKAPFDPALQAARARQGARRWQRGLMCYPMGGTIDGAARRPRAARPAVHRHATRELDEIVERARSGHRSALRAAARRLRSHCSNRRAEEPR